jgi:hypothetical protein
LTGAAISEWYLSLKEEEEGDGGEEETVGAILGLGEAAEEESADEGKLK